MNQLPTQDASQDGEEKILKDKMVMTHQIVAMVKVLKLTQVTSR